jgi:hypothetical protein
MNKGREVVGKVNNKTKARYITPHTTIHHYISGQLGTVNNNQLSLNNIGQSSHRKTHAIVIPSTDSFGITVLTFT